jgi:steroid delta-isomerase-like uncharacterized protein
VSAEENKALVRRAWEGVTQGNLDVIEEVYTPDLVWHEPDEDVRGIEAARQYIAMYFDAFPDMRITVEDLIAEGDKVTTRWTGRGTHQGDLLGIPASGNPVEITGITIHRIEGGRIAEEWEMPDMLGMMQQLGAYPEPGQPAEA